MILSLFDLKRSGKDSVDFFFEYEPEADLIDIPDCTIKMPIKVFGNMYLTGEHSAMVSGEVIFSVEGNCTRCLKRTVNVYSAEFGEDCSSEAVDGYAVVNDKINLDKIVDDTVAMCLPVSFLCKEDCKGICPGCGVNLNDEKCKCSNNKDGK